MVEVDAVDDFNGRWLVDGADAGPAGEPLILERPDRGVVTYEVEVVAYPSTALVRTDRHDMDERVRATVEVSAR